MKNASLDDISEKEPTEDQVTDGFMAMEAALKNERRLVGEGDHVMRERDRVKDEADPIRAECGRIVAERDRLIEKVKRLPINSDAVAPELKRLDADAERLCAHFEGLLLEQSIAKLSAKHACLEAQSQRLLALEELLRAERAYSRAGSPAHRGGTAGLVRCPELNNCP